MSGIIGLLAVFRGNEQVGHGYMLWYNEMVFPPVISTIDGKELDPSWYSLYTTEQRLVVVCRTVQ